MKKYLILLCVIFSFSSCAIRQMPSSVRTISVKGSGSVLVTPDVANLSLEVITRDFDIQKASLDNTEKMEKVHAALIESGIKSSDITTCDFNLSQEKSYQNQKLVYGQYAVTNRINVRISDIDTVGNIIDIAIKNGATGLDSLEFSYSKEQEAAKQARIMAVQNALETATLMTNTAGVTLGKVLSIAEHNAPAKYAGILNTTNSVVYEDSGVPISSGKNNIAVTVDVVYAIIK